MKIADTLISSLDSLRINFDINEIWNKQDIAIRDLSPQIVHYPNDDLIVYYEAFAHPENVTNDNGNLFIHKDNKDVPLSLDIDNKFLQSFSLIDRIQILAIHRLANIKISEQIQNAFANEINLADTQVTLNNGQSLKVSKIKYDSPQLVHKPIIVASTSKKKSKVGEYYLEPGQGTYGVFCGNELVEVAPPYDTNSSFHLEYEMLGDTIMLIVTDAATNTLVAKYANAHFYSLLGENDFILIDGLSVCCFTNEDLHNRLRRNVVKAKCPQIVSFDKNRSIITITYDDGSTIELNK